MDRISIYCEQKALFVNPEVKGDEVLVEAFSLTYDQNGESPSFDRKLHFLLLKTVTTVIMSGFQRLPGVRRTIDS